MRERAAGIEHQSVALSGAGHLRLPTIRPTSRTPRGRLVCAGTLRAAGSLAEVDALLGCPLVMFPTALLQDDEVRPGRVYVTMLLY